MSDSDKLSIAGLISGVLRRNIKRVIDVEWAIHNDEYAREVIRLARKEGVEELAHYADQMEEVFFGKVVEAQAVPAVSARQEPLAEKAPRSDPEMVEQYIGAL